MTLKYASTRPSNSSATQQKQRERHRRTTQPNLEQPVPLAPVKHRRDPEHASSHQRPSQPSAQPELGNAVYRREQKVETEHDNYKTKSAGSPSALEIWRWTLTRAAVAPCFVKDVFEMRESEATDYDFFYLGRVPARLAEVVGMIVGVTAYEKRIVYSLDDGTAVVDCVHRVDPGSTLTSSSPSKAKARSQPLPATSKTNVRSELPAPSALAHVQADGTIPPEPSACVGDTVSIVGRVCKYHDSRQIVVDRLECTSTTNAEPKHWRRVLDLHRTYYSLSILEPWGIPGPTHQTRELRTPSPSPSRRTTHEPSSSHSTVTSYSTSSTSVASTCPSTPASASSTQETSKSSYPRLRHPCRLHTRDLTSNTFRIYVKYYLDSVSSVRPPPVVSVPVEPQDRDQDTSWEISETPRIRRHIDFEATPTKPRNYRVQDITPGPKPRRAGNHKAKEKAKAPERVVWGFSLSHIRRVPELDLLADRVVRAERRRRERDERNKVIAAAKNQSSAHSSSVKSQARSSSVGEKDKEKDREKKKRLFLWTVRKLYEEGAIVLAAPSKPFSDVGTEEECVRPAPFSLASATDVGEKLWSTGSRLHSQVSEVGNMSHASSSTSYSSSGVFETPGVEVAELTDPDENEELYIPLTPAYFDMYVEQVIETLSSVSVSDAPARKAPLYHRPEPVLPKPGPTAQEIAEFLKRKDERWAKVDVSSVEDALEFLSEKGRVWCVGKGRWEKCL